MIWQNVKKIRQLIILFNVGFQINKFLSLFFLFGLYINFIFQFIFKNRKHKSFFQQFFRTFKNYNHDYHIHILIETYQCTNALLAYMRSNLWSSLAHASATAVVLLNMQTARGTWKAQSYKPQDSEKKEKLRVHLPVDKSSLGVHEIELVIQTGPGLGNGRSVTQHAHSAWHLKQVSSVLLASYSNQ